MIKIISLTVNEFRGIRRLSLEMKGNTFVVCGPNGTGKSGIIDAIEFALTGSITRLTGRGTKAITIKDHAPHVDSRNHPESARVVLTAWVPRLQKSFTIERSVRQPRVPLLTPNEPEIREIARILESHPEFALSRREIIKYVMVEPGQRSKDVQELLRLDRLESLRSLFVKVANSTRREMTAAAANLEAARTSLRVALGVAELREEQVLKAVNERRSLLGLTPLLALTSTGSFRDGLTTTEHHRQSLLNKDAALREVSEARALLLSPPPQEVTRAAADLSMHVQAIVADHALLRSLTIEAFLRRGLELMVDSRCPFCDTDWRETEVLKTFIDDKLAMASATRVALENCRSASRPVLGFIAGLRDTLSRISELGLRLEPKIVAGSLAAWYQNLRSLADALSSLADLPQINRLLATEWHIPSMEIQASFEAIERAVSILPDSSIQEDARAYLILADERRAESTRVRLTLDLWKRRQVVAEKSQEVLIRVTDEALTHLYEEVESDFASYYIALNEDDESHFTAQLRPSVGKLGFDVDFYGRGLFPPGAYHSEGHQDAMGLCLYLALMRHTLGEDFSFAVLDDVLMSIDSGHRREVCRLLRERFPNTQFVLTTHDETWRQFMITEGLVSSQATISFRRWTVEDGPQIGLSEDAWGEIHALLDANNVPSAAHTLRRHLEYVFTEVATRLKARVELRGDNRYELGELLPSAVGKWGDLLGKAKAAAQSWGDQASFAAMSEQHTAFKSYLNQSRVEQWAINASVHYNSWANLRPEEFARVVNAFRELIEALRCQGACKALFYVEPRMGHGQPTQIRCACGETAINLNSRPKSKGAPEQVSLFST